MKLGPESPEYKFENYVESIFGERIPFVIVNTLEHFSADSLVTNGKRRIRISREDMRRKPSAIRSWIWHEVGHILCGYDTYEYHKNPCKGEVDANIFALKWAYSHGYAKVAREIMKHSVCPRKKRKRPKSVHKYMHHYIKMSNIIKGLLPKIIKEEYGN